MTNRRHSPHRLTGTLVATILAFLTVALFPAAISAAEKTECTPSAGWGTNRAALAAEVVKLVNAYRVGKGLSELVVSSPLTASSTWKSLQMAGSHYFAHDDQGPPIVRTAYERTKDCGYTGRTWGENIAYGYRGAQAVVTGWLSSPGHRENLESASFTTTGVGVAADAGGSLYWTQSFGNDIPRTSSAISSLDGKRAAAPTAIGGTPARVIRQLGRSRFSAAVLFVNMRTGRPLETGQVRCQAEVDGRRLRVVAKVFEGESARCAWQIPGWAKGRQLTGIVAVRVGNSIATRLFMREIR